MAPNQRQENIMDLTRTRGTAGMTAARGNHGRVLTGSLWALQALLAVSFVAAGGQKLAGAHQMVVLFTKIGAGQWLRYLTGALELAGAVGLLIPLLSGLAALGLAALMAGAAATNLTIGYSPWVPLAFLLVSALMVWSRWPQTRALAARFSR
jgi:putative oxidoreductase